MREWLWQALYGFTSTEGGGFVSAEGLSGVYFLQDKELEFDEARLLIQPSALANQSEPTHAHGSL